MNLTTNLSVTQDPLGWLAIGIVILVIIAVFAIDRLRQRKLPKDEGVDSFSANPVEHAPIAVSKQEDAPVPANQDDAMTAAMIGAVAAYEERGAILAAITAAISVVWEGEHPGTGFRVVSYRHVGKRSPWNAR